MKVMFSCKARSVVGIEHRVLPGGSGWPGRSACSNRRGSWRWVPTTRFWWSWAGFQTSCKASAVRKMRLTVKPLPRPGQPAPPDSTTRRWPPNIHLSVWTIC